MRAADNEVGVTQREGTSMTIHHRKALFPNNLEPGDSVLLENALYAEAARMGNAVEFQARGEHYRFLDHGIGKPHFLNLRTGGIRREIPAGDFTILWTHDTPKAKDPDEDVKHDEKVYEEAYSLGGVLQPGDWEKCRRDDFIPVVLSEGHFTRSDKSVDLDKEYPMSTVKEHVTDADRKVRMVLIREDKWNASYQFPGQGGFNGNNVYNAIAKALRDDVDYIEIRGAKISITGLQQAYINETGMPEIKITIERKS